MYYYNYYKNQLKDRLKSYLKSENTDISEFQQYRDLGIINTSIGTTNMGDFIIYESVWEELKKLYPDALFTNFPSHLQTTYETKSDMKKKECLFVSGTNLLSSNMDYYNQWKLDPTHKRFLKDKVVLMGVGWWQYQDKPNSYTANLFRSVLSKNGFHSVRDSYTKKMLESIGITNVVNTSCPTFWGLSEKHCTKIPIENAEDVVTTLTFYNENAALDCEMLDILVENYRTVYLWIQGLKDLNYLKKIYPNIESIKLISPGIDNYNKLLEGPIDYIGTRLHAGARALQKGRRTMILAVDNRAIEIGKDIGLNVVKRENVHQIKDFIMKPYTTKINLPYKEIEKWKKHTPFNS